MSQVVQSQVAAIAQWIQGKRELARPVEPDDDLIDSRLIDSLDLAEFLFLIEDLTGRTLDLESIDLDSFRTLRRIQSEILEVPA